jgi:hypothetical protein
MGRFEHISIPVARAICRIARMAIWRALDGAGDATEAERIREGIHRAKLAARIMAARIVLRAAEASGGWYAVEVAHQRLLRLETRLWLLEKFGVQS